MLFIRITPEQAHALRLRATGERRSLLKQWFYAYMYSGAEHDKWLLPAGFADKELIKELMEIEND